MNKDEAKKWLSAYLPGDESVLDAPMLEALRMAEEDPELAAWLESRLRLDSEMQKILADEPIPAGLKDSLLEVVRKSPPDRRTGYPGMSWLIGLAALLVGSFVTVLVLRENESLLQGIQGRLSGESVESHDNFRDGMAFYIRNVYFQLDHLSGELPSIEEWIRQQQAPGYEDLPGELSALTPIGCKKLQWKNAPVTLVCFHSREGKIVHLFILDRKLASPEQYSDIQTVAFASGLETGGWVSDTAVYLLVGSDPEVDIEFALG